MSVYECSLTSLPTFRSLCGRVDSCRPINVAIRNAAALVHLARQGRVGAYELSDGPERDQALRQLVALSDVAIAVGRGEFFTLLGPSGCGKTTLLRSIAGFNDLTSGAITLDGTVLRAVPPHRRDIGMVFQDYAIFRTSASSTTSPSAEAAQGAGTRDQDPRNASAGRVRLESMAERLPAAMSGGQQQRIGLARAMVINPRLLLMTSRCRTSRQAAYRAARRDPRHPEAGRHRHHLRDARPGGGPRHLRPYLCDERGEDRADRHAATNLWRSANPFVAGFVGTLNTLQPGPLPKRC